MKLQLPRGSSTPSIVLVGATRIGVSRSVEEAFRLYRLAEHLHLLVALPPATVLLKDVEIS
jgi:hypothetical protein